MQMTPVKAEQPSNSVESILTFNLTAISQACDAFFLQGEQTDSIALTVMSSRVCEFFPASLQKGDTDGSISFFLVFITLPINAAAFPKRPCCTCHAFSSPLLLLIFLFETYGETCVGAGTVSCATAKVKGSSETQGIDLRPVKLIKRRGGSLKC